MELKKELLLALITANVLIIAACLWIPADWINYSWSFSSSPDDNMEFDFNLNFTDTELLRFNNESWKKILLWNSPERIEAAAFGTGHQAFVDAKCPVSDCYLMANSKLVVEQIQKEDYRLLETFDAVLINVHELWLTTLLPDSYRRPDHQRLVFFTQESPVGSQSLDVTKLGNVFNWTMTYQHDSDVRLLYGRIHPNKQQPQNSAITSSQQQEMRNNKTGKVAWMVSHCPTSSHREDYVTQLSKFIPVDTQRT